MHWNRGMRPAKVGQRRYEVYYPSGQCFAANGSLGVCRTEDGTVLGPTLVSGQRARRLDPRAVVVSDGVRAYDPREILVEEGALDPATEGWLAEHPEWPAILE